MNNEYFLNIQLSDVTTKEEIDVSHDSLMAVVVKESKWSPGIGNGLFAATNIDAGTIVCTMSTTAEAFLVRGKNKVSQDDLEARAEALNLPHDSAVRFGSFVFWEPQMNPQDPTSGEMSWYAANHSARHTQVRPCLLWPSDEDKEGKEGKHPRLAWRATRKILAGEEIYYDYGQPLKEWKSNEKSPPYFLPAGELKKISCVMFE